MVLVVWSVFRVWFVSGLAFLQEAKLKKEQMLKSSFQKDMTKKNFMEKVDAKIYDSEKDYGPPMIPEDGEGSLGGSPWRTSTIENDLAQFYVLTALNSSLAVTLDNLMVTVGIVHDRTLGVLPWNAHTHRYVCTSKISLGLLDECIFGCFEMFCNDASTSSSFYVYQPSHGWVCSDKMVPLPSHALQITGTSSDMEIELNFNSHANNFFEFQEQYCCKCWYQMILHDKLPVALSIPIRLWRAAWRKCHTLRDWLL